MANLVLVKDVIMILLAHIRQNDFVGQSVQAHLEEVALLAHRYGELSHLAAHAELAGFLHDMGKLTKHFTSYLQDAVIKQEIAKQKIDHSTAGAKYLYEHFYGQDGTQDYVVETIGMAILSHHSGLQNFTQLDLKPSDFLRRVENQELPFYDEVVLSFESIIGNVDRVQQLMKEAKIEFQDFMKKIKHKQCPINYLNLMQKLVFSCLIDADRTSTRCFEENEDIKVSNYEGVFKSAYNHLTETVATWQQDVTPINQLRNQMSENCDNVADQPSSIYTLTVPTGGGKTLASLRYALKHAYTHHKSRIIYVVPYTTILEQNAAAVRDIIQQPEAVLEHHANVVDDNHLDKESDYYQIEYHKQLQLGRDNWDYPIIFTTMVQFLDALYQKGTRKSRRLHNLTDAVLIFDEVQTVPFQHLSLFNAAVNFLHTVGRGSILLCTATQPEVGAIKPPLTLAENAEIVPDLPDVVEAFKRVSFHNKVDPEGWDSKRIAEFIADITHHTNSLLIILNTKTAVKNLYQLLVEQETAHVVHLSTSMCPAHRKQCLKDIQRRLGKEKVICISTQLIEAGVDISFETVIRSLAGLDSIAQAAGRCNRHGEHEKGNVYVIRANDEHLSKLPEIRIGGEVMINYILSDPQHENHWLGPKAMSTYFKHFFAQAKREVLKAPKGLDHELISLLNGVATRKKSLNTRSVGMFKTLERYFEAIDSPTTAVIVPFREGDDIIASLNGDIQDYQRFNQLMKEAQQYSVNLFDHELQKLSSENLIVPLFDGSIYCLNEKAYDEKFGVTLDGQSTFTSYQF